MTKKKDKKIIKLALGEAKRAKEILANLQESMGSFFSSHFLPKAQHILVSLLIRYKKQRNIEGWTELMKALPKKPRAEYVLVIKEIKSCYRHSYYDPEMTWEDLIMHSTIRT
jgi:hypothetical protein